MKRIIAILIFNLMPLSSPSGSEIVIAVHQSSPRKSISLKEIKSIFTGEKSQWKNGKDIKVIDYKRDTHIKKVFCEKVLKISQVQLYKKWIRASLLGNSNEVVLVSSPQEVLNHLTNDPYSVGYLEKPQLKNSKLKKLKVTK